MNTTEQNYSPFGIKSSPLQYNSSNNNNNTYMFYLFTLIYDLNFLNNNKYLKSFEDKSLSLRYFFFGMDYGKQKNTIEFITTCFYCYNLFMLNLKSFKRILKMITLLLAAKWYNNKFLVKSGVVVVIGQRIYAIGLNLVMLTLCVNNFIVLYPCKFCKLFKTEYHSQIDQLDFNRSSILSFSPFISVDFLNSPFVDYLKLTSLFRIGFELKRTSNPHLLFSSYTSYVIANFHSPFSKMRLLSRAPRSLLLILLFLRLSNFTYYYAYAHKLIHMQVGIRKRKQHNLSIDKT
ncbi:hypothetical protein AGLY_018002 [Aphis glycines]|uniref:Uncharacterized protein n=1 Tax=Aphis glycines TaxID=307491 RepID=A0A6G0STW8_APHGL|nr:hypothetical protein AGLY_018002 [Aphis glycines]